MINLVMIVGAHMEQGGAKNLSDFGRISHELGQVSDVGKAMMTFKGIQCPKSVGPFGAENISDSSPISHELAYIKFCSAVSMCKGVLLFSRFLLHKPGLSQCE